MSVLTISALLPYPIFSPYTNITQQNAYEINNFKESEISNNYSISPKMLNLDFEIINQLLPQVFEIIDVKSEESLFATRVGGNNHADIIFEPESLKRFHNLCNLWSWNRRPVIVKLSENAYLPACIICYPHGYENHFCLHFKNSKTHGTNRIDIQSKKAIEKAKSYGAFLINENN